MKVATILPTPLLGVTKNDDYLMCLYQEVKSQPEYAKFFRERSVERAFVIMDNGAAEGQNPSWKELLEIYPQVNPSEVVLPDVIYNKEETTRQTREAYLAFERAELRDKIPGLRYMVVPQGETFEEWEECMIEFVHQQPVTIGISKFVTPKYADQIEGNVRLRCVKAIIDYCGGVKSMRDLGVEIHLLGCWDNPKEIGEIEKAFPGVVRGTDSAIAYVYTRNYYEYDPRTDRPDNNEIDFKVGDPVDMHLLLRNVKAWKEYCEGIR